MSLKDKYQQLLALSNVEPEVAGENWLSESKKTLQETLLLLNKNSRLVKAVTSTDKQWQSSAKAASRIQHSSSNQPSGARYSDAVRCSIAQISRPKNSDVTDRKPYEDHVPAFLPVVARLVSMRVDLSALRSGFASVALMHFFDPVLFPILVDHFKSRNDEPGPDAEPYQRPKWWPQLQESLESKKNRILSPLEYSFHLTGDAQYQLKHLVQIMVKVLNLMAVWSGKVTSVSVSALGIIMQLMLENKAQMDAVILIMCHNRTWADKIHSWSILSISEGIKKTSSLIMELIVSRQSVVTTLAIMDLLPGADRFMGLYSQKQRAAYELVAKNPIKFVLDLLDHKSALECTDKPIIVSCMAIASQKIARLSQDSDLAALYDSFSKHSNTRSLYVVLCSFGIDQVEYALLIRRDYRAIEVLRLVLQELKNSLPPFAKPNYFFVDRKPPNFSDSFKVIESAYDLTDLYIGARLTLLSLAKVAGVETRALLEVTSDKKIAARILQNNFQYFFVFALAVLVSHPQGEETEVVRKKCETTIRAIADELFEACATNASVLYVTLFNFANDICHLHTDAIQVVAELIRLVINDRHTAGCEEFVASANELFHATFGSFQGSLSEMVNVHKADFSFLYGKKYKGYAGN